MINTGVMIAVVEDDDGLRMALEQLLRSAGFRAATFESAEEFLAHANRTDAACLIADVNLPGITGAELVQKVRSNGQPLPSVLITGRRDIPTAELARQAEEVPLLYKPFSDAALFEVIDRVMRR